MTNRKPAPTTDTAYDDATMLHILPLSQVGAPDAKRGRADTNPAAASTAVGSGGGLCEQALQVGGLKPEAQNAGVRGGGSLVEFTARQGGRARDRFFNSTCRR
jgi:hypothetical protein